MYKKITLSFLIWRVALFLIAFLAIYIIPVYGARFPYVDRVLEITHLPNWIWGFGGFDGVHYLRIAQDGYFAQFSQAFFPLFPILIKVFSSIFPRVPNLDTNIFTDPAYFYSGLILANSFFLGSLYILYKLILIDFKKDVAFLTIILLLVFPTSFYFGAVYTESLFLLLAVLSVYLVRKNNFFWAAVLISLATATRVFGVLLIPLYIIEVVKNKNKLNYLWTLITPLGILSYMYFLKTEFNNPISFLTSQPLFGAGRSGGEIILLPQVIYRYLKIFVSIDLSTLGFLNAFLEFTFALVPLTFLIVFFKKMRLSYWIFSVGTLLLPTFTGTFSSMPRYVLIPMVLLFPTLIIRFRKYIKPAILISCILGVILTILFIRGYWVA
ncbi:MAG TPA: mannosyltransferase family protein [Patescibacteria group bacterium]|nr:mannosyltransferase family protein [Patescibacteria group bacterium]